jgi:hypothetical protein
MARRVGTGVAPSVCTSAFLTILVSWVIENRARAKVNTQNSSAEPGRLPVPRGIFLFGHSTHNYGLAVDIARNTPCVQHPPCRRGVRQNVHTRADCDGSTLTATVEADGVGGMAQHPPLMLLRARFRGSGDVRLARRRWYSGGNQRGWRSHSDSAQFAVPALLRSGRASRKTLRPRNGAGNNGNYVRCASETQHQAFISLGQRVVSQTEREAEAGFDGFCAAMPKIPSEVMTSEPR